MHFWVNPSTCSASLKKNPPIFMKLSWRSFLFCLFLTLKFHFLDLFFSNISCCDWNHELYNLKLTVHVILFLQTFRGCAGLSGCCGEWVHVRSVGGEEMHTHVYFCLVQYGTRGKCPSFSCKDFFLTLWHVGSCLCLSSTQHLSPFHVRAVTCNRPGNADAWITISQKVLDVVCTQLGQIAFACMATWRNLADKDVTELILESDSDTHSLEDEDISAQRNSDADSDTGDATDTNFTQWTDSTNCWPTSLQQTEAPDINKDSSTECFCAVLFWNYTTAGRDEQILSLLLGQTGQSMVPIAWHDCSGYVFVFGNYCADGAWSERLLVDTRSVLNGFLQKHYEMR